MIYCLLSLLKTEARAHFGVCPGEDVQGREGLLRSWGEFHCAMGVEISLLPPTAALMPKGTQ